MIILIHISVTRHLVTAKFWMQGYKHCFWENVILGIEIIGKCDIQEFDNGGNVILTSKIIGKM